MSEISTPTVHVYTQQHVPNEIILHILTYALTFQCTPPINIDRFRSFLTPAENSRTGRLDRFLCVSKTFSALALDAFYQNNSFNFVKSAPVFLPPPKTRHLLQRIDIAITVSLYFSDDAFGSSIRPQAATVDEVVNKAPGWKQLKFLTDSIVGFSQLRHLSLKLKPPYESSPSELLSYPSERFIQSIRTADVVVKADVVVVDISGLVHSSYWQAVVSQLRFDGSTVDIIKTL